ncbi:MAG: DNA polymerase III subunit delta [Erysipelotrichaceae bacterium]|jgi:DNA polymerase-3 subunit delta'|nr:DNA polymerase III subunit delta [Erysipelotrichaceae bacterium]
MTRQENLKMQQPVIYQLLQAQLRDNRRSHAYLFSGSRGSGTKDAAILLAQSLVCQNKTGVFACETCSACQRIANGSYGDLMVLDGREQSIKKAQIQNVQNQFNKTALESSGEKIYILDGAENATDEALNSLLKFLEEPAGMKTTAILLTQALDKILPTIRSRCQIFYFNSTRRQPCFEACQSAGLNFGDSWLLSQSTSDVEEAMEISQSSAYTRAREAFIKWIPGFVENPWQAALILQNEGLTRGKNREENRQVLTLLLSFCASFFRVLCANRDLQDDWWRQQQAIYRQKQLPAQKLLQVVLEIQDQNNRVANTDLLADQFAYRMWEVTQ